MKLLAFAQDGGARRLGVLDGDVLVDVTDSVGPDPLLADLERMDLGGPRLDRRAVRVLAPVTRPGKIICVG
ncbi:MAG: FAA hydrolase family protein, partial [Chloroflexi bacterium]|nr:FAA hydrolase family protein [Chloroflexota bacterium]